jgi:hypothetical protein
MFGKRVFGTDVRPRPEASQLPLFAQPLEAATRIQQNSVSRPGFLAQKIEVGVTAGTRIDDGGKVSGKIVGNVIFGI